MSHAQTLAHDSNFRNWTDTVAKRMPGLVDPMAVRKLLAEQEQEPVAGTGHHFTDPAAALIHHLAVEGRLR